MHLHHRLHWSLLPMRAQQIFVTVLSIHHYRKKSWLRPKLISTEINNRSLCCSCLQPCNSPFTWDVLCPANDHHQFPVCQVTEGCQGFDVTLRHGWIRHGINLLWFSHQQVGDDLSHCTFQRRTCCISCDIRWIPPGKRHDYRAPRTSAMVLVTTENHTAATQAVVVCLCQTSSAHGWQKQEAAIMLSVIVSDRSNEGRRRYKQKG